MRTGASLNGASVQADLGTFGARGSRAAVGQQFANGIDFTLSGNYERSDGPQELYFPAFDSPDTNNGIAYGLDDESLQQAFGRVALRDLTFTGSYGRRNKGIPTASFGAVFNDPRLRTTDERAFVDAQYDRSVRDTKVAVRGYFDRYSYEGVYPYPGLDAASPAIVGSDYAHGSWWGVDGRVTRAVRGRQTLTVGGEFRDNVQQNQGGGSLDGSIEDYVINSSSRVTAAYIQDEVRLHHRLLVNVGLRYDGYGGYSRITPRAAVILTPSPTRAFKYLYGTAFRAPNVYELAFYSKGIRNPELRPETIATHELVWEQYIGKWMRTSVSGYTSDTDRLITLITGNDEVLTFVNDGAVRAQGVEFESELQLARGVHALGSYSLQRATDKASRGRLTNSPSSLAQFRVSVPGPVQRSFLSSEIQYISDRRTLAGNTVAAATVMNATLIMPVGRPFELFAGVRDLFNERGYDPGSEEHFPDALQKNGRTFRVGIRWIFARQ
jgi:iron complex outermembrane receptor protein